MPIFIKDYCWQQTDDFITIKVPFKNVNQKNIDLLTTNNYIKASYNPYIFEIFLSHPIDKIRSKCFIQDQDVIFELCKIQTKIWDKLELNLNKLEKLELRKQYLEEIQNETQETIQQNIKKKTELKRIAVRQQIKIDTKFRETIDNIKKEETQKALAEMKLWEAKKIPEIKHNSEHEDTKECKTIMQIKPKIVCKDTPLKINSQPTIPLPRKCQSVNISFTAREFPTPSRESKAEEEQEWLTKQAEARRSAGFHDDDLRPEERNPQWLKDKGDEFYKAGNYLAAISAYSSGIKISKNLVSLYVNRSAAHFAIGNFHKTIDDCSTAIDLMTPICEANKNLRAKSVARRGAALCKLGLLKEGKGEVEAALKLMPNDDTLKQDLLNIEKQLQIKSK